MNRKILTSLLVVGVIAAVAGGSTFALFNDTETSSGNTFTAGALDLKVDWEESYNGEPVEDQELTNNPGPIFDIEDVKPGDHGEATVSLHVFNNPAYVNMNVTQTANFENGCTEPEAEVDDSCGTPGEGEGELGENLHFTVWNDDGDNVLQEDEEVFFNGTAEELDQQRTVWLDGDAETEGIQPFENSTTEYVGISWKVPRDVGNEVQTDSKQFNFSFYAEQARHNEPDMPGNGGEQEENLTPVNWQVDLAKGEVIEDLEDEQYGDRLERAAHGTSNESGAHVAYNQDFSDRVECIKNSTPFVATEDYEAQINFSIHSSKKCQGHNVTLASYLNTGDIGFDDGSNQELEAFKTEEVDKGEDYQWEIDLPEPQASS